MLDAKSHRRGRFDRTDPLEEKRWRIERREFEGGRLHLLGEPELRSAVTLTTRSAATVTVAVGLRIVACGILAVVVVTGGGWCRRGVRDVRPRAKADGMGEKEATDNQ